MLPLDLVTEIITYLNILDDEYVLDALKPLVPTIVNIKAIWWKNTKAGYVQVLAKNGKISHTEYRVNSRLHSTPDDRPTVQGYMSGHREWHVNDKLHRVGGPAIIYDYGTKEYYNHGKLHRDDGPAIITDRDVKKWYKHGKLHRDNGPAIIGYNIEHWYNNGKLHRDYGPAIIDKIGEQHWCQDNLIYRSVITRVDGTSYTTNYQRSHKKPHTYCAIL